MNTVLQCLRPKRALWSSAARRGGRDGQQCSAHHFCWDLFLFSSLDQQVEYTYMTYDHISTNSWDVEANPKCVNWRFSNRTAKAQTIWRAVQRSLLHVVSGSFFTYSATVWIDFHNLFNCKLILMFPVFMWSLNVNSSSAAFSREGIHHFAKPTLVNIVFFPPSFSSLNN